jgi:thioredoxin reductase (NADPH)
MGEQVKKLGGEIVGEEVGRIEIVEEGEVRYFKIITESAKEVLAKALIIATGTERRKLGVPGEAEFVGRGISYCPTCDAPFFKDKIVALIGGANAACSGAAYLAEYAKEIYLIYRKEELRAEPIWIEEVKNNPKIKVVYNTNVTEILSDDRRVTGIKLDNPLEGKEILEVEGVFVEIGGVPASNFLVTLGVELDKDGYIKVNEKMETNIAGVFAAGDVTTHGLVMSQAITACADGAIAAGNVYKYLKGQKAPKIIGV